MGRGDTGRWVARAAATGGGRTYRGHMPVRWDSSLVLIVLLGVASIAYSRYERQHRIATRPLYLATQMLADLYTDDRQPARIARKLALRVGARLRPFRKVVMAGLTADAKSGMSAAHFRFSRP